MDLDKRNLYRLPWSMNDNPIAWLEITDICNLKCEGCYRSTISGHKPLEEIKEELRFFKRWRNPDNVSIAGGEPLLHPQIREIVSYIRELDMKPIILTNAAKLTPAFLKELKQAGLAGFTIHIDSHQGRPGWEEKSEAEHNELRQYYAEMIHKVGGLYTIFNCTVYPSTYDEIPDILRWGQENIRVVQGLVFITYRTAATDTYKALDIDSREVDMSKLSYITDSFDEQFVTGPEVVAKIHSVCPV
ncbi:MAG: radical SAM protein, partial [Chloroflexota bacterium]|nr:radical SAM protein [Chloroflexota bacterium]